MKDVDEEMIEAYAKRPKDAGYSDIVKTYIASVDGCAHQSAIEIIQHLERIATEEMLKHEVLKVKYSNLESA